MLAVIRASRVLSCVAVLAMTAATVCLPGCRATNADVERWAETLNGPRKLVAVVTHGKYAPELRVAAAMALVQMKPRGGQHVGLQGEGEQTDQPGLLRALSGMHPASRAKIVSGMVPYLVRGMTQPAPAPGGSDPSIPYKDAAYALLTHDDGLLVASDANRQALRTALAEWAMSDFVPRLGNPTQAYGMEQVLRELGPLGVRRLPEKIEPGEGKIGDIASLVAELGDAETKARAGARLVEVAKQIASDQWKKDKEPSVRKANEESRLNPTPDQFRAQLDVYQEEELLRVFSSMKKVGGDAIVGYLIDFAKNVQNGEKRRGAALAALEGWLDKSSRQHVKVMLDLASDSATPDSVRDLSLRRVGEMPRAMVINDLYALFNKKTWRVRWVAAELVLKMSDTSQLGEFMAHLGDAEGMAITEAIRYGNLLGKMKGPPPPIELAERFATPDNPAQARVVALGYFLEYGTKADLPRVQRYEDDRARVPQCGKGPEAEGCEWKCAIGTGNERQLKDIERVGDFVRYCVQPAIERRSSPAAQAGTSAAKAE
ncbi:MAG: hypothetical protein JW940_11870 [Polyangiaceae bacterium]|nr:hypothetical protein [Polyangiaceae bacterium]